MTINSGGTLTDTGTVTIGSGGTVTDNGALTVGTGTANSGTLTVGTDGGYRRADHGHRDRRIPVAP